MNAAIPKTTQNRSNPILDRYKNSTPTAKRIALIASAALFIAGASLLAAGGALSLEDIVYFPPGAALTALFGGSTLGLLYLNKATAAPHKQETLFTEENPRILPRAIPLKDDLTEEALIKNLGRDYHRRTHVIEGQVVQKRNTPSEEAKIINDVTEFAQAVRQIPALATSKEKQDRALYYLQQDVSTEPLWNDFHTQFPGFTLEDSGAITLHELHVTKDTISTKFSGKAVIRSKTNPSNFLYATYHIRTNCATGEMSYWFTDMEQEIESVTSTLTPDFHTHNNVQPDVFPHQLGVDLNRAVYFIEQNRYVPNEKFSLEERGYQYMLKCTQLTESDCVNKQTGMHFSHQTFPQEILHNHLPSLFPPYLEFICENFLRTKYRTSQSSKNSSALENTAYLPSFDVRQIQGADLGEHLGTYSIVATVPDHTKQDVQIHLFRKMPHTSLAENLEVLKESEHLLEENNPKEICKYFILFDSTPTPILNC